jgi:hypothetical protein
MPGLVLNGNRIAPVILFFVCATSIVPSQAARPMAPDAPVAAPTLALGHGGASTREGVSGMLHNPATLRWAGGAQAEIGLISLSSDLSPYAIGGYQIPGGAAGAFGGFRYLVDGYPYQGVIGGFSWGIGENFSVGFGLVGAFAKGGFGTDGNGGLWYRMGLGSEMGFWVRNIMASGIGEVPEGLSSERSLGFGFGTSYDELGYWKFKVREIGLHYDFSTVEVSPQGWRHAISGQAWLPPSGSLGFIFGLSLDGYHPLPEFAYGLGLRLPFGGGGARLTYAISPSIAGDSSKSGTTQSISLRYEVGRQVDVLNPRVHVEALPARICVDSVGLLGLYFKLAVEDPDGQPATWELQIIRTDSTGTLGPSVRRYQGKELPPRLIRWEGRDAEDQPLSAGLYAYRFSATDKAGHLATAPLGVVELAVLQP